MFAEFQVQTTLDVRIQQHSAVHNFLSVLYQKREKVFVQKYAWNFP